MPPVVGLFGAIASGLTSVLTATGLTGLVSFTSLSAFLTSPIGSLVVGIGLQLIIGSRRQQRAPSVEASKVNVRVAEPERWIVGGEIRQGGAVVFAEFDADGNFWYVLIHCDSILTGTSRLFFDDVPITVDFDGNVITDDFCLDDDRNSYSGSGTRVPYFKIYTTTYSETNPTPPAIIDLINAFPGPNGWTSDHRLVGTTYSVIKVKTIPTEHRYKVFKWRGPIGLGEPAFAIVGKWSHVYDPRDPTQTLGDRTTYKYSENSELIWAWFRTHRYGRGKSESEINWAKVAEKADICDQIVNGLGGTVQSRYACSIAIPDSKERAVAEQEISASMDGQLVFDNDGKTWVQPGYYYTPTLSFNRYRDILGIESVEAVNGESETQGVIVRYIDPDANYTMQPSAPWINPRYYVEGETPKYLTIDIPTCRNHNQAMRLAKSNGERSQPEHKLLPTVGLRGIMARQERIIDLSYDNTFSGDYEIVTPVEIDKAGIFCGMGIVPINPDRWTLLAGEEKAKPVANVVVIANSLALPSNVVAKLAHDRVEVTFDPIPRDDWIYQFQYKQSSDTNWSDMTVETAKRLSYSGTVDTTKSFNVRYRTKAQSGKVTPWVDPFITLNDADVTALFAEMTAAGETPNTARKNLIAAAISMLKSTTQTVSLWAKLDTFGFRAAHGVNSAKINWKAPSGLKAVTNGGVTFLTDRGFKGDGVTGSYVDTQYNPGDGAAHLHTLNSNMQMFYVLELTLSSMFDVGTISTTINNGSAAGFVQARNSVATTTTSGIAAASGFLATSRNSATEYALYVNSSKEVITQTSTSLTNRTWWECGYNSTTPQYATDRIAAFASSSGLTDDEILQLKNIVEFYLRGVSAIS